jgi:GT2 family glycosyltransferase
VRLALLAKMTSVPNTLEPSLNVIVGIVTKNRADILPKSIESVLLQQGASIKISVIDDGSRDATSQSAQRFPSVEWITWTSSRGHMAARNYWMTNSNADYFVGLDDDAWFLQGDEIEKARAVMETNSQIGAIAFDILSPDRPEQQARNAVEPVSSFIGCGHMLRLSAVKEVGGYEEAPGLYGSEEKDLSLRLMDAGYQIALLRGVHVWHDKTRVEREIAAQHESGVCNDLVMALRRTPALLLPVALLSKFYRHLMFSMRNDLTRPALGGFGRFFKAIPRVLRSRKPVKTSTLRTFMRLRAR